MKKVILIFVSLILATSAFAKGEIYTSFFNNKAISGYDAVSYFSEGGPVKGDSDYTLSYKGADWYFSSAENLETFKANPEQYAPQYGGHCAWALSTKNQLVSADPLAWKIVDGKLYLNYSQSVLKQWEPDAAQHIIQADKNWKNR